MTADPTPDDKKWKLTKDEAQQYADQLRAMSASQERRALLAQELEACAAVIVRQAAEIERLQEAISNAADLLGPIGSYRDAHPAVASAWLNLDAAR